MNDYKHFMVQRIEIFKYSSRKNDCYVGLNVFEVIPPDSHAKSYLITAVYACTFFVHRKRSRAGWVGED